MAGCDTFATFYSFLISFNNACRSSSISMAVFWSCWVMILFKLPGSAFGRSSGSGGVNNSSLICVFWNKHKWGHCHLFTTRKIITERACTESKNRVGWGHGSDCETAGIAPGRLASADEGNLSVGLQLLSSASEEGLLLQAAPYMALDSELLNMMHHPLILRKDVLQVRRSRWKKND